MKETVETCPFSEEQIKWLSENLSIDTKKDTGHYGEQYMEVILLLQGKQISYTSIT